MSSPSASRRVAKSLPDWQRFLSLLLFQCLRLRQQFGRVSVIGIELESGFEFRHRRIESSLLQNNPAQCRMSVRQALARLRIVWPVFRGFLIESNGAAQRLLRGLIQ